MREIHQTHNLSYPPEKLYQLVSDVERYPEFLPWCQQVKILRRRETESSQQCDARVTVGFKGIRQTYQCRVDCNAEQQVICVEYLSGPLADLYTRWAFTARENPNSCTVDFHLRFALRNRLFGRIMDQLLLGAIERMTDAFVLRAHSLYGTQS